MHWQTVILIILATIAYAVIGGVIFHFIEAPHEESLKESSRQRILTFLDERPCINMSTVLALSKLLAKAKSAGLQVIPTSNNLTYITNWDMTSSIFLAFQVIGSVGYGNSPPKTVGGRIFCMVFALFGIPLLLVSALGIGYMMLAGAERLRKCCIRGAGPRDALKVHIVRTLIIFVITFCLLILIPAAIYTRLESRWSYGDAIYFCLTTVLTLGFGDFIPGSDWSTDVRNLYRLGVGFWLIISLLCFAGFINSIQIAIASTREMREPLNPGDDLEEPYAYDTKKLPEASIAYIPQEKTPRLFAEAVPVTVHNPASYMISRGSLYHVTVPQGEVTHVTIR